MAVSLPEPAAVYPESLFETELAHLVEAVYGEASLEFAIHRHFGLDLTVFVTTASGPRVRMLEAKAYNAQRQGGVGFGNGRGEGPQVDLLHSSQSGLRLLDQNVRWVLADATLPQGASRYACFDCTAASQAAMGGVARGKQNNFSLSALKPRMTTWGSFCELVEAFLLKDCN